jgi:hypothetical protein
VDLCPLEGEPVITGEEDGYRIAWPCGIVVHVRESDQPPPVPVTLAELHRTGHELRAWNEPMGA